MSGLDPGARRAVRGREGGRLFVTTIVISLSGVGEFGAVALSIVTWLACANFAAQSGIFPPLATSSGDGLVARSADSRFVTGMVADDGSYLIGSGATCVSFTLGRSCVFLWILSSMPLLKALAHPS